MHKTCNKKFTNYVLDIVELITLDIMTCVFILNNLAVGRAGDCICADALSRRVHEGGSRAQDQSHRSQSTGKEKYLSDMKGFG